MKLILEINDTDLGMTSNEKPQEESQTRNAARAVILNSEGLIAFQFVSLDPFHKLPGGGVEEGETIEEGLRREILEEVGCEIEIITELGETIEHRYKYNLLQTSYCYLAKVKGAIGTPSFDESELADGMKSLWISLDEAIASISEDKPESYEGRFIVIRDRKILEEAKKFISTIS